MVIVKYPYKSGYATGIILSLAFLFLMACDSEYITANDELMGYSYYPLNPGEYKIFEVVDINYTIQNEKDSSHYYVKEILKDSSINKAGEKIYYIYRYQSKDTMISWEKEPIHVLTVNKSNTNLIVYEESVPYVKLTFPVKSGLTWDGNAFNTQDPLYYFYSVDAIPVDLSDMENDRWVGVIQNDFDDQLIRRDVRYEIYAEGIGLIYKELSVLDYCQEITCLGEKQITSGIEIRQTLIGYGNE